MGYDVGDAIALFHEVRDIDGALVNADTVTLTITKPDLTESTPTVANPPDEKGQYESEYLLAALGRHRVRWVTTVPNTAETFEIYVDGAGSALPTLAEVKDYLNSTQADLAASYSDAVIQSAYGAEQAAQRRKCRIPADFPADLAEALKRRVQRNLAMRPLALAVLQGDAELGSPTLLPGDDPEVRRFERPHRKMIVG